MSKPWGGVGAWALEAERAEAEELDRAAAASVGGPTIVQDEKDQSFPSLKEAVKKPKKKKGVSLSLSEFSAGTYVGPGGARREAVVDHKGLTHDEMLQLPTGPRERSAEEVGNSRLGGGFRSYGYGIGGGGGSAPLRRRSDLGGEEERRSGAPPPRASDLDLSSRADEVDNWATAKKFVPSVDSGRQERHGSLGGGGSSKADEVDNWSLGKKSAGPPPSRHSGFGSGFRDNPMIGADSDRWARGVTGSLSSNGERERPRLVLDPPKRDPGSMTESARSRPNPFGSARPREEVLAEKGLDWKKMEQENEVKKNSRPSSSQSSRPTSAQSSRPGSPVSQDSGEGAALKPRPKVNPFGNAKPREVVLQEKGMNWRKIDLELEHRGVDRSETDVERKLKQEIDNLKKELAKESGTTSSHGSAQSSAEYLRALNEQIRQMENELDQLTRELDNKVRFGQRTSDAMPGSGSGRPSSRSGVVEDSFMERPRSRGIGDSWSRHTEEQRGFERSKDLGFSSTRSSDRPKSRERW